MSKSSYSIALRREGATIATLRMDPGGAAAEIGRSHKCALKTPSDDHSVSGLHARLFWKGGSLWMEDAGSRNGVFCSGEVLKKPRKVADGDIFAVGNCSVLCERIEEKAASAGSGYHKLERLNGDDAGKTIEIKPREGEVSFTIGLDPTNDLCLPDMLVSRRHATLTERENGECWIRDLDSKNGTYVNGEPLRGKERLLKDNDKIGIAYFDFRFLDRGVAHTRFFLWLKIFAIAVTLCVMAGVYIMWVTASSTVDDYLRHARQQAENRDFSGAKATLEAARIARDADKYRTQIDALDSQVELWERTSTEWNQAQAFLSNGQLQRARKVLDPLTSGVLDAWVWNGTTAVEEKRKAELAAQALRWYYDAEEVLADAGEGQPEDQADRIRAKAEPLAKFMEDSASTFATQPYMAPLAKRIADVQGRMNAIGTGFAKVDSCIAKLDSVNPDFSKLVSELEEVSKDKSLHLYVRAYADKYKAPCTGLAEAKQFIGQEFAALTDMRFKEIMDGATKLALPKKELCARHPRLSDHRQKLEGHHADVQNFASNLDSMVVGLAEKGVTAEDTGTPIKNALDIKRWENALTFDCLAGKPPASRRQEPFSPYDELVGLEFTYQSLRALPENYSGWCLRMIGFSPDVVVTRKAFEGIDVFVEYMDARPAWMKKGKLGAFLERCRELQGNRRALVTFLSGYKGSARAELITGFYAGYFSDNFDLMSRKAVAEKFKALQREILDLCEKYSNSADPAEQISLRTKIIDMGLPGDPELHSKWVQRYEGGNKQ